MGAKNFSRASHASKFLAPHPSQNPVAVPAPLSELLEHLRITRININDSKL